jgi:hypothetical protein
MGEIATASKRMPKTDVVRAGRRAVFRNTEQVMKQSFSILCKRLNSYCSATSNLSF